jgi:hypothetical protein
MNPTSGVSPITPMIPLLATLYAWTFFEIWRLRFNETLRPRLFRSPDDAAVHVARRNAAEQPRPGLRFEAAIAGAIQRYWLRGSYVAVFVAAFVVWLTSFHPSNPFVLFETGWFGALYGVLFCLVVALMLSAGCRVAQMWSALHGLLGELERSRVRLTFVRLKDRSWSFWRQGGEDTEWAYMARSKPSIALGPAMRLQCPAPEKTPALRKRMSSNAFAPRRSSSIEPWTAGHQTATSHSNSTRWQKGSRPSTRCLLAPTPGRFCNPLSAMPKRRSRPVAQ